MRPKQGIRERRRDAGKKRAAASTEAINSAGKCMCPDPESSIQSQALLFISSGNWDLPKSGVLETGQGWSTD